MSDAEGAEPKLSGRLRGLKPFEPGKSGNPNGRPKGSRNKLSEAFLSDFFADWQANGPDVIQRVRLEKPDAYLKVAASLLPKQVEITNDAFGELSDDQLSVLVAFADAALGTEGEGEGATANATGSGSVN